MRNYKKALCLSLVLLMLTFLLTGCIRMNVDINIKKNGKADVTILYAVQEALQESGTGSLIDDDEAEQYKKDGWTVNDYSDDNYTGYTLTKTDVDLSKSDLLEDSDVNLTKKGSLYVLDLKLLSEEDMDGMKESASMIKSMGGSFTVTLTLPKEPVKHNATSVSNEGKTLKWDLLKMDPDDTIHVEFKLANYTFLFVIAAAVLIAAAAVLLILKKRTKANDLAPLNEYPSGSPVSAEPQGVPAEAAAELAEPDEEKEGAAAPDTPAASEDVPAETEDPSDNN